MSALSTVRSGDEKAQKPNIEKKSGQATRTNSNTPEQMHHELSRYVVAWLGALSIGLIFTILMSFFLEQEKFKLIIPGLISIISGVIGYIAGHTARGKR
jgi:predicted lipid-binding transport protein (Tim44 family)